MEVLDSLEKHFFEGFPPVQIPKVKGDFREGRCPEPDDAFEKRRELLRKLTKDRVSYPTQFDSKSKGKKLHSSFESFPLLSKHGPNFHNPNSRLRKWPTGRHILSLSDQNLSQRSIIPVGLNSTSCSNLRMPVSSRTVTEDIQTSRTDITEFGGSVKLPALDFNRLETTIETEKEMRIGDSEVKLPDLFKSQTKGDVSERVWDPLDGRVLPEHWRSVDVRDCVTPVRTAIFNVEHDWILHQEYAKSLKRLSSLNRALSIRLPDKEADQAIKRRLKEVKSMVKRRAELWHVWELMDDVQKQKILKAQETSVNVLKKDRRKKWTNIDVFRNAAHMCFMLVKAFVNRRAYVESDELPIVPVAMRRQVVNNNDEYKDEPVIKSSKVMQKRSSLGFESQLAMSISPSLRREEDIKLILWVLRATKAFNHLFPAEMETELAKVVAYEKYDDGRIIAKQGRTPDRFYYIMTGKVHLIREFVLNAGTIQKSMGYLTKGMTTDPNELDNAWLRDVNMVAKGQVEVLLIEKTDFARLQHTTAGPPVEFLRNIELFHEFPCEMFFNCDDILEVKYYSQKRIIVEDSNRTPWLHVIKSGKVKVVRKQKVFDTRNDKLFSAKNAEGLGCVRPFSHADAMLGILAQQRKMEKESQAIAEVSGNCSELKISENLTKSATNTMDVDRRHAPPITTRSHSDVSNPDIKMSRRESRRISFINIPTLAKPSLNSLEENGSEFDSPVVEKRDKPNATHVRKAYLQLDVLKTGDVFGLLEMAAHLREIYNEGLEHMERPLASEAPGVILISDGAEVIRINKRFFLQHAPNNTMLKIETMQREYMTEEEAISQLYNTETWFRYKTALMSRTIDTLTRV